MKKGLSKIIIIILITIFVLIIVGLYFYLAKKPQPKPVSSPTQLTQLNQLPIETNDFKITYDPDQNTLTITPNILFDSTQTPSDFFKKNWDQYNTDAHVALKYLEDHQLGKTFRTNFGIKIVWWQQAWWPAGKGSDLLDGAIIAPASDLYQTLVNETSDYSIKLANQPNYDLEVDLYATLNGSDNPEADQIKLQNYLDELKAFKKEVFDYIKSKNLDLTKIRIYWIPSDAKDIQI